MWSDQLRRVAAREEMDLSLLDRSALGTLAPLGAFGPAPPDGAPGLFLHAAPPGHDQSGQAHSVRIDHVQAEGPSAQRRRAAHPPTRPHDRSLGRAIPGSLLFAWCTSLETGPVSSVDDSPALFVCLVGGRADDLGPGARISLQRPWYGPSHGSMPPVQCSPLMTGRRSDGRTGARSWSHSSPAAAATRSSCADALPV